MNEQTNQNPSNNPTRSANQGGQPGPDTRASSYGKNEPNKQGNQPGSPGAEVKEPKEDESSVAAKTPARPDNKEDSMNRQQSQSMPSTDQVKGVWKQQVGAAKIAWGKLTEDELLKSEGHAQKLAGLVQERYAVTRDEADKQIKNFFDKNTH